MKKNIINMMLFLLIITSCSGPKEKKLKIQNAKIIGDVSEYLKVVDGEYTLKKMEGNKLVIPVKFEVIKTLNKPKPEIYEKDFIALNKENAPISDMGLNFRLESLSDIETLNNLLNEKVGEIETVNYEWSYFGSKDRANRIFDEMSNFKIKLNGILYGDDKYSAIEGNQNTEKTQETSKKSKKKWDKVLKDYDEYVDEYLKFYKKAMKGDQSALSEYPALMEKATKLQESLEQAQNANELTPSQIAKMSKIQAKLLNGAMELQ